MIQQAEKVKHVFISHPQSEPTHEWVARFADSMRTYGAVVWLDETDVQPGEPTRETLAKALRKSDLFVFVVSPESVMRPSVLFEIGAAVGVGKPMVAVVPKGFDVLHLPEPLRLRRHLVQVSPDETARRLISVIEGQ